MTDYADIIERLENATGRSDWNLDKEIAVLMREEIGDCADAEVPAYTSSIDAAVTLMPEGWEWELSWLSGRGCAKVGDPMMFPDQYAATPAIALCIAALKARAIANGTSKP